MNGELFLFIIILAVIGGGVLLIYMEGWMSKLPSKGYFSDLSSNRDIITCSLEEHNELIKCVNTNLVGGYYSNFDNVTEYVFVEPVTLVFDVVSNVVSCNSYSEFSECVSLVLCVLDEDVECHVECIGKSGSLLLFENLHRVRLKVYGGGHLMYH